MSMQTYGAVSLIILGLVVIFHWAVTHSTASRKTVGLSTLVCVLIVFAVMAGKLWVK